jgi:hypothetical protein
MSALSMQQGKVSFRWKDYCDHDSYKTMTLESTRRPTSSSAASCSMCFPADSNASVTTGFSPTACVRIRI